MRQFLKFMLVTLICLLTPFAGILAYAEYKAWPMSRLCQSLTQLDTPQSVLHKASQWGLSPMTWSPTKIWYFKPESPPFFRFACEVDFQNNRVSSSQVVDAD